LHLKIAANHESLNHTCASCQDVNRYNSFNLKFTFLSEHAVVYSVIMNQTLYNCFVNTSNVSVMNVSCRLGI